LLHCGADYANNHQLCSGSDPREDFEAIETGFDLLQLAGGNDINASILEMVLSKHSLAIGTPTKPRQDTHPADFIKIPWPYPVGTFDDGSSGILVRHRLRRSR
jgi:hypothetical protein